MAKSKASEILADINAAQFNPSLTALAVVDSLMQLSDGNDFEVVDVSNPFMQLVETAVMTAYSGIEADESILRRTYPIMATNREELYAHMSDKDFIDPFAQPAPTEFTYLIGKQELINKAVPRDTTGVRKLVIPADTSFNIAGYTFTMQYPIELRVMPHGGIQVVYDTSTVSPVRELESNMLSWQTVQIPFNNVPIEMLAINIPVLQYKVNTFTDSIIKGTKFKKSWSFNNQFFYARVWLRSGSQWVEISTTHSERVIDPFKVMAKLTVKEGVLDVHIPDVYIRNGSAVGDVRVDIYTTYGAVDLDLMSFNSDEFKIQYSDIGSVVNSMYYTPLQTFSHLTITPRGTIVGGRNALSFEALRDRVLDNAIGGRKTPISPGQLTSTLNDMGYKVSRAVDYVTSRVYHATAPMPASTIADVTTPIGTVNGIVETSEGELSSIPSVRTNGRRLTIMPETLYYEKDGVIRLDDELTMFDLKAMRAEDVVAMANSRSYLFTPFHYVLDFNSDVAESRAYYLDSPKVESRIFVNSNITLALDVSTGSYEFMKADRGYILRIATRSSDLYKELQPEDLFCQISFTPRGYSEEYAALDGTLIGYTEDDEAIFEFYIETNLDIDRNNDMVVTNFTLIGDMATPVPMQLDVDMNVLLGVRNYTTPEFKQTEIDTVIKSNDASVKGVTHEVFRMKLGTALPSLWSNIRTITSSIVYKRYTETKFRTYSEDVYMRNPETGTRMYEIIDGVVHWHYLHRKGDTVLDPSGNPIVEYTAGDIVYDASGNPEIEREASIGRRLDMFLLDGRYAISNTEATQQYLAKTTTTLINQITVDIPSINTKMLEKTKIYLFPEGTMGRVNVLLADGSKSLIFCENEFNINYYMTSEARRNTALLKTLRDVARESVRTALGNSTISTTSIADEIKKRVGSEIIDVIVEPMGVDKNQKIITVIDEVSKLTIGKKLVLNADNSIAIKDNITIGYNKHESTTEE